MNLITAITKPFKPKNGIEALRFKTVRGTLARDIREFGPRSGKIETNRSAEHALRIVRHINPATAGCHDLDAHALAPIAETTCPRMIGGRQLRTGDFVKATRVRTGHMHENAL